MKLHKLFTLGLIIQLHFASFGQSIFDDCEIYAKWTEASIILKSGDTITAFVKYNPFLDKRRIEIKDQKTEVEENVYSIGTEAVNELSYFESKINAVRRFKNIEISLADLQERRDVFSEVYFDNKYFAIIRLVSHYGYPSLLNPLGKPSNQLGLFIINKMTKRPFKSIGKKDFMKAMADKRLEVKEYVKKNRLKFYALEAQIEIFEYYAQLKG